MNAEIRHGVGKNPRVKGHTDWWQKNLKNMGYCSILFYITGLTQSQHLQPHSFIGQICVQIEGTGCIRTLVFSLLSVNLYVHTQQYGTICAKNT